MEMVAGNCRLLIVSLSALFTIYLTNKLAENERRIAALYQLAQEELQASQDDPELDDMMFALEERLSENDYLPREEIIGFLGDRLYGGDDITLNVEVIEMAQSVPVLLYDYESDSIYYAANFGLEKDIDPEFFVQNWGVCKSPMPLIWRLQVFLNVCTSKNPKFLLCFSIFHWCSFCLLLPSLGSDISVLTWHDVVNKIAFGQVWRKKQRINSAHQLVRCWVG